ncbi:hypothetical protein [Arsenophonus nasoniae]|uniref:Uncharacterized protein n=1 Tax=Arsenophonus nasoniae TaxID=638 RepID=A0AA95K595_9GAMM|nr:hypothetical protein [Arsenophonus nasoniae]WGM00980.1 hypothetical protein QE210_14185 [Arsenophonus nasoniae]
MLNPAVTIKNPSAMTYQAIQQQFRQCLSVMDKLNQEGFIVSQFTVDGYSRPTLTLLHDRRCDALHKNGHAVRYALGTDRQGRWEKYQFLQDNCRIIWEVR